MERTAADYLFTLSLYDEPVLLSKLLFHLEPSGKTERTAYLRAKADLRTLEKKNLVALSARDGAEYVCLTIPGRMAASALAETMAEEMVRGWQFSRPA